jgi:hypothetical protein
VPTVVIPADGAESSLAQPRTASLLQALAVKKRVAASLLAANTALFGVGVGQSLDNPADAALVLFADRNHSTASLPTSVEGQRVRLILMDRFHVTRSHASPAQGVGSCGMRRALEDALSPEQLLQPDQLLHRNESLLPRE